MMFNNNKLPLLEAQAMQREFKKKQPDIKRDPLVDKELCLAYQQGNMEAGVELIYRYMDKISYILRFPTRTKNRGGAKCKIDITSSTTYQDHEDLFQEVIYHFLKLLLEYDPAKGDLQGLIVGKLHLRVFYYHYGDLVDIRMNEGELDDNYDMEEEMKDIFLGDEREVTEETKQLYLALANLSPRQRQVAELCIAKGWSSVAAADEIGASKDTIRDCKRVVIRKLRKHMEEAGLVG